MANLANKTTDEKPSIKSFFSQENVKAKFAEMLGQRAPQFITSVLQVCANSKDLADADPISVFNSAAVAATLDLPVNSNLGFAYIIAYFDTKANKKVASLQLGYKGYLQLAQRSGQFKTISATPIYEGQLIEENPLTGFLFDFKLKKSDKIIGYAAYFKLINGFEKTLYMPTETVTSHGKKYSKTFAKGYGLWKDDFDAMATKTVLKLLLSKFAPLSIEMQRAIIADQAVINDADTLDVTYTDNEPDTPVVINKEHERIELMINDAKTMPELAKLEKSVPTEMKDLFNQKVEEITKGGAKK